MPYYTTPASASGPGMTIGDPAVFNVFLTAVFKERVIVFGDAGADIVSILDGVQPSIRPPGPTSDDLDSNGDRKYKQVVIKDVIGVFGTADYEPAVYGELTAQSFHALQRHERMWDDDVKKFLADRDALVQYILVELSVSSKTSLKTHPTWDKAVQTFDYVSMFLLILHTHQQGTSKSRLRHLRDFVTLSQGNLTLDGYIGKLRPSSDLMRSGFEDPNHPGYVSINLLNKCVFLLGRIKFSLSGPSSV